MSLDSKKLRSSRYRALVSRFSAGSGIDLVYCPFTGAKQLMQGQKARLLEGCRVFATLDEHAGWLCAEFGLASDCGPTVRQQLEECVDTGLLLPYGALIEQLAAQASIDKPATITCVGVPTKNRTEDLMRCMQSYGECARHYGKDLRFIVVDDSETEHTRDTNQQGLKRVTADLGIEILYASTKDKQEFARELANHSGLAAPIVNFALWDDDNCPTAVGSSRNALLLCSIGELLLQVDDDTSCRLARGPQYSQGLTITSQDSIWEYWFGSEDGKTPLVESLLLEDVYMLHEQLLGRSINSRIMDAEQPLNFDGASALLLKRLRTSPGKVSATTMGLAGDSGMGMDSRWFLKVQGQTRNRLHQSETCYKNALVTHQLAKSVPSLTISDSSQCMLYHNLGLDNRELLPPFLPILRGEDGVFGELLGTAVLGHCFGFLPWVVSHSPVEVRHRTVADLWKNAGRRYAGSICRLFAASWGSPSDQIDSKSQLSKLGRMFADIGSLPLADFEGELRLLMWNLISAQIAELDALLTMYGGQPKVWCDDIKKYKRIAREATLDKFFMVPVDLGETFGGEAGLIMFQRLLQRFGELLQIWSDLRQAAADLRKSGYEFGKII